MLPQEISRSICWFDEECVAIKARASDDSPQTVECLLSAAAPSGWSLPAWAQKPGRTGGDTAGRHSSFWHVPWFYLLSLASALLPVPKTFTRTCFESSRARHTPSPVILRFVQGRCIMKVIKDRVCPFLFQVFPIFLDLNIQE